MGSTEGHRSKKSRKWLHLIGQEPRKMEAEYERNCPLFRCSYTYKAVIYVQSLYHAWYGCGLLVVGTDDVHLRTTGHEI